MTSNVARGVWVLLLAVALLALAGCATGAVDCAIGKPVGVVAALGAGVASLFDPIRPRDRFPQT